jgi:adenylate cyclase
MENRKKYFEENWYWYLTGENKDGFSSQYEFNMKIARRLFGLLPGAPRCFECNLPFSGLGSLPFRTRPSTFSPRLCDSCEKAMRREEAGAEVALSMLFADVRGSTTLAEATTPSEFKGLIQRFYQAASGVLVRHNAMVNRLMGDQVIGLFVPRFAGSGHAKVAIAAALDLLRATGHEDQGGPWVPVGIGVHTGLAYVGAVGSKESVNEIAVLGSAPNFAARLSAQAADGEVLVSEAAAVSAELATDGIESRRFDLKGISQPVSVRVLRLGINPIGAPDAAV